MQHFILFVYLFVVLTGVVSLALTSLVYVRTRDKLLSRYIFHVSALTLFVFVYLFIVLYLHLNVDEVAFYVVLPTVALALLSSFVLMYTIPMFTHSLVWDEPPRRRNLYCGILAGIAFILMISSFRVNISEKTLSQELNIWVYLSFALFFLSFVYAVVLKAASLRRLEGERRRIVRSIALLELLILLAVVLDMHLYIRFRVFAFSPFLYSAFFILFTRYIAKQYSAKLASVSSGLDKAVIEDLLNRTGISSRESEIILLMSTGLGNKEIADKLFISLNTVKTHNRNIFQKMGVKSRFQLLVKLRESAARDTLP